MWFDFYFMLSDFKLNRILTTFQALLNYGKIIFWQLQPQNKFIWKEFNGVYTSETQAIFELALSLSLSL